MAWALVIYLAFAAWGREEIGLVKLAGGFFGCALRAVTRERKMQSFGRIKTTGLAAGMGELLERRLRLCVTMCG